jgi:hypothetical protein
MTRLIFLFAFLSIPASAFAQPEPPAVEIRGAFGASRYLHGDLGYTAPTWLVAVRFGRDSFVVEPEFATASHEERQVFGPAPGSPTQTTTISSDTFQSAAVNVLGRWGRSAAAYAGGGAGLYWERSRYRVEGANGYEQNRSRGPRLGAQLVAGVDIPIVSRIKAFGQFRYEIRSFEDPGGGSVVQGLGGIAIGLW